MHSMGGEQKEEGGVRTFGQRDAECNPRNAAVRTSKSFMQSLELIVAWWTVRYA